MKKVCVVTGGGSGIGFAAAKEAAKKGYYVMIVGRNEKKLAGAVEEMPFFQSIYHSQPQKFQQNKFYKGYPVKKIG